MNVYILEYHVHIKRVQFYTLPLKYGDYSFLLLFIFWVVFVFVLRQGVTSPDWPGTASLGLELQLNHHSFVFLFFSLNFSILLLSSAQRP